MSIPTAGFPCPPAHGRWWLPVLCALLMPACAASDQGGTDGGSGEGSEETGGSGGSSGGASTADPSTSGGSSGATTGTGTSSTSEGGSSSSSGGGEEGTSTDGDETTAGADSTGGDEATGTGTGGPGGDTDGLVPGYDRCEADGECVGEAFCVEGGGGGITPPTSVCAPPCEEDMDCPPSGVDMLEPTCAMVGDRKGCLIPCMGFGFPAPPACPGLLECSMMTGGSGGFQEYCLYPEGPGDTGP